MLWIEKFPILVLKVLEYLSTPGTYVAFIVTDYVSY